MRTTAEATMQATGRTMEDILYVQSVDEKLGQWTINFRVQQYSEGCNGISHSLTGYGRTGLMEHVEPGTPVIITGNINVGFILRNTNIDHSGRSCWDNNLTNEQYINGMLENGCYMINL